MSLYRIAVHDYEKLQMNPEKALQLMAKKEEEQMRKERKLRAQQHEVNAGRRLMSSYIKRPSMTADYLDDYDDEEDDDVGRRYDIPVKRQAPPAKKAKRKKVARDDEVSHFPSPAPIWCLWFVMVVDDVACVRVFLWENTGGP